MIEQPDLFTAGVAEAALLGGYSDAADAALRKRCRACGPEALQDVEVLQLVLARCRGTGAGVRIGAEGLLDRFGGMGRILGAPRPDLARIVGADAADELGLLHDLMLRALATPLRRREVLSSWEAVNAYLRARLAASPREVFHVLFLDRKNQLIADERLSEGTVDHAPAYPREVVRRALELSASAIILAHNHPSGDPTPSKADIDLTRQMVAAAKALQIAVHDHLVVGEDQVVSLRAQGLM